MALFTLMSDVITIDTRRYAMMLYACRWRDTLLDDVSLLMSCCHAARAIMAARDERIFAHDAGSATIAFYYAMSAGYSIVDAEAR